MWLLVTVVMKLMNAVLREGGEAFAKCIVFFFCIVNCSHAAMRVSGDKDHVSHDERPSRLRPLIKWCSCRHAVIDTINKTTSSWDGGELDPPGQPVQRRFTFRRKALRGMQLITEHSLLSGRKHGISAGR